MFLVHAHIMDFGILVGLCYGLYCSNVVYDIAICLSLLKEGVKQFVAKILFVDYWVGNLQPLIYVIIFGRVLDIAYYC